LTEAPAVSNAMLARASTAARRPAPGLRRRLAAAFAAKLSWVALQFVQQFVLVPVFLYHWGTAAYADWVALFSAASAVTLFDFGLAHFYSNGILISWSKGDRGAFDRQLKVGLCLLGACAFGACAIAIPAAWIPSWIEVLNLEHTAPVDAIRVLLALAIFLASRLPLGLAISIYRARGDQAAGIVAETLTNLAQFAAVLLALYTDGGLADVAFAHAAAAGLSWLGALAHLRRRYPDIRWGVAWPSRHELSAALHVGPYFAALPAALAVQIYGVVLVATTIAAPVVAVVYTTHRTLTGAARIVVSHLGQAVATELARQHSEGDFAAFGRLYAFLSRLVGGASGGVAGVIAVFGAPVMSLWTLDKIPFDPVVFWSLLAAGIVSVPAEAADKLLGALNRPRPIAIAFIARSAVAILACLALVPFLGAGGVALAILVAETVTAAWMLPREAAREGHVGALHQAAIGFAAAGAAFAVSAAGAHLSLAAVGGATVREIVGAAILWTLIAPPFGFFIVFNRGQRRLVLMRARAAFRRVGV
jgi:O-antigen/teichoic acid export membrane protein